MLYITCRISKDNMVWYLLIDCFRQNWRNKPSKQLCNYFGEFLIVATVSFSADVEISRIQLGRLVRSFTERFSSKHRQITVFTLDRVGRKERTVIGLRLHWFCALETLTFWQILLSFFVLFDVTSNFMDWLSFGTTKRTEKEDSPPIYCILIIFRLKVWPKEAFVVHRSQWSGREICIGWLWSYLTL